MVEIARLFLSSLLVLGLYTAPVYANDQCEGLFVSSESASSSIPGSGQDRRQFITSVLSDLKKKAIDKTLNAMAIFKGLPKYLTRNEELKQTGKYLEYSNFGEMGLAEIGVSVRYNQQKFESLRTEKPLIVIANHPLGIADGLALQYIVGRARAGSPSLLLLARWVEKILPHAIYGDAQRWGTAIPVDINKPNPNDPLYESKLAEIKSFNSTWTRTSLRVLKNGGALIVFPAGHVAGINKDGQAYPKSVYDEPGSWTDSVLNLARLGKADIAFAYIDSVNSEAFYKNRKRFGGGDKERVVWFFGEAVAQKGKSIDVKLSKPMNMDSIYEALSSHFGISRSNLEADSALTAELMRQYTHKLGSVHPQELDTNDLPRKISTP